MAKRREDEFERKDAVTVPAKSVGGPALGSRGAASAETRAERLAREGEVSPGAVADPAPSESRITRARRKVQGRSQRQSFMQRDLETGEQIGRVSRNGVPIDQAP